MEENSSQSSKEAIILERIIFTSFSKHYSLDYKNNTIKLVHISFVASLRILITMLLRRHTEIISTSFLLLRLLG